MPFEFAFCKAGPSGDLPRKSPLRTVLVKTASPRHQANHLDQLTECLGDRPLSSDHHLMGSNQYLHPRYYDLDFPTCSLQYGCLAKVGNHSEGIRKTCWNMFHSIHFLYVQTVTPTKMSLMGMQARALFSRKSFQLLRSQFMFPSFSCFGGTRVDMRVWLQHPGRTNQKK